MKAFKRSIDSVFKIRTLLYFGIPLLAAVIIIFANHLMDISNYKKIYEDFYFDYFDEIFRTNDNIIQSAINKMPWLVNHDFERVFTAETMPPDTECVKVIRRMNDMRKGDALIDSMAIVNRKADFVLATSGRTAVEKYFDEVCVYNDYNYKFWIGFHYPIGSVNKLPPTSVSTVSGEEKYIMPVVFSSLGDITTSNIFILNIDLSKILDSKYENKFTPNTGMYFVNKKTREMYSSNSSAIKLPEADDKIWDKLVQEDYARETYTDEDGRRYIILSHTASPNLMEYSYVILVPEKDISHIVSMNTFRIILITALMLAVLFALSVFFANKLHLPFGNIVKALDHKNIDSRLPMSELVKNIERQIISMGEENDKLKSDISKTMNAAKERQIMDIVTSSKRQKNTTLLFKYNSFVAMAIKLSIQEKTEESRDWHILCGEIYDMIKNYFCRRYDTYTLPSGDDSLHILMNVPEGITEETIVGELNSIEEIIRENDHNIKLEHYIGGMHSGIEGIKKTYDNVKRALSVMAISGMEIIHPEYIEQNRIYYQLKDENIIINNIVIGDYAKAQAHIEQIMLENIVNDVAQEDMHELYVHFIHAIFMALNIKRIDVSKLFGGKSEISIYENLMKMSQQDICIFILNLFGVLGEGRDKKDTVIMIDSVKRYIQENYQDENLCLDAVAEHFQTNSKYISKLFKKNSDVQFHDYLTGVRIEQAKELLKGSDMKIEDIYTAVGYVGRSTFIRAFKSREGITPTAYRENNR